MVKALESVEAVTEKSQYFIVEIIRNLAEYLIYSEKFKRSYMDTLIERSGLTTFNKILQMNNRLVNMQLI